MFKKAMLFVLSGILMVNLCGCFALVAGVVGGAGTAVWLSGKLSQEFHAPYHATIDATKSALHSLSFPLVQETQNENVTQIKSTYSDGRDIWIDIHRVTDISTRVEVRVGANADKAAASMLLKRIQDNLPDQSRGS